MKATTSSANNRFDRNHYHLGQLTNGDDVWADNDWIAFAAWQATGQDANSTIDSALAPTASP